MSLHNQQPIQALEFSSEDTHYLVRIYILICIEVHSLQCYERYSWCIALGMYDPGEEDTVPGDNPTVANVRLHILRFRNLLRTLAVAKLVEFLIPELELLSLFIGI